MDSAHKIRCARQSLAMPSATAARSGALMAEIYGTFLFALAVFLVLGVVTGRARIAVWGLDNVSILARILASITAAGLLSLAFVADALATDAAGPMEFFTDSTARDSLGMVLWLLTAGASGLLFTLVLVVMDSFAPQADWLATSVRAVRRCVSRGLVLATLAVLLLFPAVIVVILATADVANAP